MTKRQIFNGWHTERHRQTSLWIWFLIIRWFGNLKVIILFTWVIFPDYLIPKVISDYLSIAFRENLMITVAILDLRFTITLVKRSPGELIKLKDWRCTWLKKLKIVHRACEIAKRWTTLAVSFFKGNYHLWLFSVGDSKDTAG
jgi:hypothetical protein